MKKWVLDKDALEFISSAYVDGLTLQEAFVEDENGGYEFGLLALDKDEEEEGATPLCSDQNLCFNEVSAEQVGYEWARQQLIKMQEEAVRSPINKTRGLFSLGVLRALSNFSKV